MGKIRNLKILSAVLLSAVLISDSSNASSIEKHWGSEFYSENQYLAKAGHLVSDSRIRLHYSFSKYPVKIFIGAHHSKDWHSTQSIRYSENYLAPTIGLIAKIYGPIYSQLEQRFRFDLEKQSDPRVGFFSYYSKQLANPILLETYGESFFIFRISNNPITTAHARILYLPFSFLGPYSEIFFRESKNQELGTRQREFRLGLKSQTSLNNENTIQLLAFAFQRVTFLKSQEPNSAQAQVILQGDF